MRVRAGIRVRLRAGVRAEVRVRVRVSEDLWHDELTIRCKRRALYPPS